MFAVGRPLEGNVAVRVRIVELRVEGGNHFTGGKVEDLEGGAVFEEGYFLAVGREGGLLCRFAVLGFIHHLLDYLRSVSEATERVGGCQLGGVDSPQAVALPVVNQFLAVGREADAAFLSRSVGDALCGGVLDGGDVYIAAQHESYLLAVGGEGDGGGSLRYVAFHTVGVIVVCDDVHGEELRFPLAVDGVNLSVLREGEFPAVGRGGEGAHRMILELGDLALLSVHVAQEYVVVSVAVVEVEEGVGRRPTRILVGAVEVGELCEIAAGWVVHPDVRRARRAFVLAEHVFVAFAVLVEDFACGGVDVHGSHGHGEEHLRAFAGRCGHGVHLALERSLCGGTRWSDRGFEEYRLAV